MISSQNLIKMQIVWHNYSPLIAFVNAFLCAAHQRNASKDDPLREKHNSLNGGLSFPTETPANLHTFLLSYLYTCKLAQPSALLNHQFLGVD